MIHINISQFSNFSVEEELIFDVILKEDAYYLGGMKTKITHSPHTTVMIFEQSL